MFYWIVISVTKITSRDRTSQNHYKRRCAKVIYDYSVVTIDNYETKG